MSATTTVDIPLVDLRAQHDEVSREVAEGFERVMATTGFIGGPVVDDFERALGQWWGSEHVIGVGNGTDALELMLRAAGVGRGDEVIVPANSFIATASAVVRAGARPVFVDVDPVYLLIDPERVAEQLTDRTRAVIAVHLFGQMAPMEALADAVSGRSVVLLEDAAQAHGARRHDRPPGSVGVAAATSFYPGKNLGAYGDGGAVLTDRVEFARRVRLLSNHGATSKYNHAELGFNSRLDALQAVVLHAKLARLSTWNGARRRAAAAYGELLGHMGPIWLPEVMAGNEHVWHLYPIRLSRRDELLDALQSRGIGAGVHYPVPLHLQGAFADLGHRPGQFPNAEEAAARLLSLPLHPHLTSAQQEFIASVVTDHVA
ncbi:MAG TPA: DegT/DnrJ/EryC1/StrS family aminotransferase [Acidimicrobiales bacterium]